MKNNKQNIYWALALVCLFSLAYLIEEKGILGKPQINATLSNYNFELNNLSELILPQTHIRFTSEGPKIVLEEQEFAGDSKRIEEVLKILSYLKIKRVLKLEDLEEKNLNLYFGEKPPQFEIILKSGEKLKFKLGESASREGDFYLEFIGPQGSLLLIVEDQSPFPHIYMANKQDHSLRLKRFHQLLNSGQTLFFQSHPFEGLEVIHLSMNWEGGPTQHLDFLKNELIPPPPNGVSLNEKKITQFLASLSQLSSEKSFPERMGLMAKWIGHKMGSLEITTKDGNHLLFFIYEHQEGAEKFWLEEKIKNSYYLLRQDLLVNVLPPRDYFWNKAVVPPEIQAAHTPVSMKLEFSSGKSLDYEIPGGKQNVGGRAISTLLAPLFALESEFEAFRMSEMGQMRENFFKKNPSGIKLYLGNYQYWIDPDEQEIRVMVPDKNLVYHYFREQFKGLNWSYDFWKAELN